MTQWGLDTLFNPAKRHMDEEKRRLQSTRSEVGDNSGGKRIDLESGKVTIPRANEDEASDDEASDEATAGKVGAKKADAAQKADAAKAADVAKKGDAGVGKPSPAAERAAKRRARKSAP